MDGSSCIVLGDALRVVECMPSESIHLTFTSPPYFNAREYAHYDDYEIYLSSIEVVSREVHRVTKEGRFFIINTSPVLVARTARKFQSKRYAIPFDLHHRLIAMGWDFIDDILWVKPEPSVKNRIAGFQRHRKPLAYKPNACNEYLMVYRKSTDKLIDWNMKQYDDDVMQESLVDDDFNTSNVWNISPEFSKHHEAVFPIELARQVVKLYSLVGDTILDPFGGSGTTGKACVEMDRRFVLVDSSPEYVSLMQNRVGGFSVRCMDLEGWTEYNKGDIHG